MEFVSLNNELPTIKRKDKKKSIETHEILETQKVHYIKHYWSK